MQASRYLPDKPSMVRKALYEMSEEQFAALIALQGEVVGSSHPPLPKDALRPQRLTHWVLGRKRVPAQQID